MDPNGFCRIYHLFYSPLLLYSQLHPLRFIFPQRVRFERAFRPICQTRIEKGIKPFAWLSMFVLLFFRVFPFGRQLTKRRKFRQKNFDLQICTFLCHHSIHNTRGVIIIKRYLLCHRSTNIHTLPMAENLIAWNGKHFSGKPICYKFFPHFWFYRTIPRNPFDSAIRYRNQHRRGQYFFDL